MLTLTCIIHEDVLRKEVEFKQSFQLLFFLFIRALDVKL